jgi:hypothetical protein
MAAKSISTTDAANVGINLPFASACSGHEGSASQNLSTEGVQAP